MTDISVLPIDRVELAFAPRPWAFAAERRREIDAHFAELQRQKPATWNGRVLLLSDFSIADCVFRGSCFEADFASMLAWRDWDFPDRAVKNCFAMGRCAVPTGASCSASWGSTRRMPAKSIFPPVRPNRKMSSAARLI
jgi:hypothetical protein